MGMGMVVRIVCLLLVLIEESIVKAIQSLGCVL
jgi:hypothetical protein